MKLSHFNFDLPGDLLAEYPSEHRDEARLMVLNREKQTIEHKYFKDLIIHKTNALDNILSSLWKILDKGINDWWISQKIKIVDRVWLIFCK